ncbi:MAG: SH3 domain-containing protein [Desulfobacterales bacterium]|jgi:hypothetical protein
MCADNAFRSIQIKDGRLRAAPSFLGGIVGSVRYGDRVRVLERKGAWSRVAVGSNAGWIHDSALTEKEIVLRAGAADVERAATTDELALAGKGFNSQVEERFRADHPGLDFSWVDRMETFRSSADEVRRFLKEGGLSPKGGVL